MYKYVYIIIQREISVSKHFHHIPVECTNESFCWIHFYSVQEVLIFRQAKFHRKKIMLVGQNYGIPLRICVPLCKIDVCTVCVTHAEPCKHCFSMY